VWQIDTHFLVCDDGRMPKTKVEPMSRIHCRVSHTLKEKVEAAARISGQSLTSFTEMALAEKAQQVLQQEEHIQLSQSAFQAFLAAIQAPPAKPSDKLLAALKDSRRRRS
jgi:uncharacterized protein (DUF1778 family)